MEAITPIPDKIDHPVKPSSPTNPTNPKRTTLAGGNEQGRGSTMQPIQANQAFLELPKTILRGETASYIYLVPFLIPFSDKLREITVVCTSLNARPISFIPKRTEKRHAKKAPKKIFL